MEQVAKISDIPHCGSKLIMVDDQPIALFNLKGKILAWDNRCPHRGGSLADGNISEEVIQCKFHLWEFDTRTKCAIANPTIKVKSYPVQQRGDNIYIDVQTNSDKT